jgi:class 3 adenylate cyclase
MPVYMDRHKMPPGISLKDVEGAHHADMQVQDKYGVNFLTYWFDQEDGAVFCLADAPSSESLNKVHGESHGSIPHEILEVDLSEVDRYLGRISDPEKDSSGNVNIDSPLRTILFTDLKGSTDMITNFGDVEAIRLLEIHDKIIRDAISKFRGREVKHTGDGFLVAFVSASNAINCAVEIQRMFKDYNSQAPDKPLNVRIGLNAGQPIERGGDLFGMVVNLASRFCDHAIPGQILSTGIIFQLLDKEKNLQQRFSERDKSYFKGFPHAIQVYEIKWDN